MAFSSSHGNYCCNLFSFVLCRVVMCVVSCCVSGVACCRSSCLRVVVEAVGRCVSFFFFKPSPNATAPCWSPCKQLPVRLAGGRSRSTAVAAAAGRQQQLGAGRTAHSSNAITQGSSGPPLASSSPLIAALLPGRHRFLGVGGGIRRRLLLGGGVSGAGPAASWLFCALYGAGSTIVRNFDQNGYSYLSDIFTYLLCEFPILFGCVLLSVCVCVVGGCVWAAAKPRLVAADDLDWES